jgi:hypothetical protein
LGFFYYEKSRFIDNFIYHEKILPIFLLGIDVFLIINLIYFFSTTNESIEIFRIKYQITSLVIYILITLIILLNNYYEFRYIKERRRYFQPFHEIKEENNEVKIV